MRLKDKKVITFVDNEYNDLELWYPIYRLQEEGATVHIVGEKADETYQGQAGLPAKTDYAYKDINPEEYDGLLVPGGWAPHRMRRYAEALDIVKAMDAAQKPTGAIGHAGWVLGSDDILKGVKTTSTPAIQDDMRNAGAEWVNEVTVVDGHIISSRSPADMPVYVKAYADKLAE